MASYDSLPLRLAVIVDELKLDGRSMRSLSEAVGQSHAWLGSIIEGNSKKPAAVPLARLCEDHGYNVRWLLTGLGPKYVDRRDDERWARERGEPAPVPTTPDEVAQRLLERPVRKA